MSGGIESRNLNEVQQQRQSQEQPQEWELNPPYRFNSSPEAVWTGKCNCGRVKYKLTRRSPLDSKFCHCRGCQVLHGAPFQWAAIFHKDDMHFETGTSGLSFYNSSTKQQQRELPCKVSCSFCHTPIMDEGRNMILLFPELLRLDESGRKDFEVRCHIFYTQRLIDIDDSKPKWSGLDKQSELIEG